MVRSSFEDVITDHVFRSLKLLKPRWWIPEASNTCADHSARKRISWSTQEVPFHPAVPSRPRHARNPPRWHATALHL